MRKASPGLLKNVRLGGGKGGDKGATAAGAKKGRKKSEDSATEKKKKEPAKKKPKQPEIKVNINSDSSDDDSDSDLEELRKKMLKPGLKLASSSQSTSGNLIYACLFLTGAPYTRVPRVSGTNPDSSLGSERPSFYNNY